MKKHKHCTYEQNQPLHFHKPRKLRWRNYVDRQTAYSECEAELERMINWVACEIESHSTQPHQSTCIGNDLAFKVRVITLAIYQLVDSEMAVGNGVSVPHPGHLVDANIRDH